MTKPQNSLSNFPPLSSQYLPLITMQQSFFIFESTWHYNKIQWLCCQLNMKMIHKSCIFFIRLLRRQLCLYLRSGIILLLWHWLVIFCESCNDQVFFSVLATAKYMNKVLTISNKYISFHEMHIFAFSLIPFDILFFVFIALVFLIFFPVC